MRGRIAKKFAIGKNFNGIIYLREETAKIIRDNIFIGN